MKRLLVLALMMTVGCNTANSTMQETPAPEAAPQDPYLELLRSDIRAEKVALITNAMQLTEQQSGAFWPVYREYEVELSKIWDGRLALINRYGEQYGTMTDEGARDLIKRFFDLEERQIRLNRQYFPRFERAVGAVNAVKFFQVEHRVDLLIDVQIASELPLIATPE